MTIGERMKNKTEKGKGIMVSFESPCPMLGLNHLAHCESWFLLELPHYLHVNKMTDVLFDTYFWSFTITDS